MAITLTDITKKYDGKTIINHFSYTFPSKGIIGIKGPSGCGKTTLLRLIAGLESPDSGTVSGNDCNISYVFQEDRLIPNINALQNIAVVSSEDLAIEWITKVALYDEMNKYPFEMSGGMCRRVSIARALAYNGDILLLDEPFTGLEIELKTQIMEYIIQFSKKHLVLLVSHDQQEQLLAEDNIDLS